MEIEPQLTKIAYQISQAEAYLEELKQAMHRYEQAGMYPAVPTYRWKDEKYMYCYFPDGANGLKLDAKSRLYIGADPAKIEEAYRLAHNRSTWESLARTRRELQSWLNSKEREIDRLSREAEGWQRLAGQQLGLEIAGQPGAAKFWPQLGKGLGPQNAGNSGAASPNGHTA